MKTRSFNGYLTNKIQAFLESKNGCKLLDTKVNSESVITKIQDSLGFVYEIEVKTIGRVQNPEQYQEVKPFKLERVK